MKTAVWITLGAVGLAALVGVHYDAYSNNSQIANAAIDTISSALGQRKLEDGTVTIDPCIYVRPGMTPYPSKWGCVELEGTTCQPVSPLFQFFDTVVGMNQTHACLCTAPGAINKPGVLNGGCDAAELECINNAQCGDNAACNGASGVSTGLQNGCFCNPGFINTATNGTFACTPIQPTALVGFPASIYSLAFISDGTPAGNAAAIAAIEEALEAYLLAQLLAAGQDVNSVDIMLTNNTAIDQNSTIGTILNNGTFTATQMVNYNVPNEGDMPPNATVAEGHAINEMAVADTTALNNTLAGAGAGVTETASEPSEFETPAPTPAPVPPPPEAPSTPTGRRYLVNTGTEFIRGELPEASVGDQLQGVIVSKSSGSLSERVVHVAARGFPTMMAFSIMEAEAGDIEILHYTKETMSAKITEVSTLLSSQGVLGFKDYFRAQTSLDKQMELWSLATLYVDGGVIFDPTFQALAPLEMWATLEGQEEVATCLSDDESRYTSSFISAKKNASSILNAIKSMVEKKLTMTEALKAEESAVRVGCKIEEDESSERLATFADGKTGDMTLAKKSTAVKQQ